MIALATRAAELGWSRRSIESNAAFSAWANEAWFQELLASCQSLDKNPKRALPEFLASPVRPTGL